MKHRTILSTFLLLCCFSTSSSAQELTMMNKFVSGKPVYHAKESEIPFRLLRHKITIPVFLNDEPSEYVFVLDTGALTFIAEHVATALELEKGQSIPSMDEDETAYLTRLKSIRLGQMEVKDLIIPRMDLQTVFDSTFIFAGFIGSDYLRFFMTTIDYRNCALTLSQPADTVDSHLSGYRIPMEAPLPLRFPYVDIAVNDSIKTRAMIDTGSPFSLVMPLSFEARLCRPPQNPCLTSVGTPVKWPSTDPPHNCLTRLSTVRIGELVVKDLPTILTELPMMVGTPLLGKDFLDKYVIELDYPAQELRLSPFEDSHHETNVYATGLGLRKHDGSIVVSGYWEGSPASRCGIHPGDRILEVNGINAHSLTQDDVDAILRDDTVTSIHLGVKHDENVNIISLEKTWLLPTAPDSIPNLEKVDHEHD